MNDGAVKQNREQMLALIAKLEENLEKGRFQGKEKHLLQHCFPTRTQNGSLRRLKIFLVILQSCTGRRIKAAEIKNQNTNCLPCRNKRYQI